MTRLRCLTLIISALAGSSGFTCVASEPVVYVHVLDPKTGQPISRGNLEMRFEQETVAHWFSGNRTTTLKQALQPDGTAKFSIHVPLPSKVRVDLGKSMADWYECSSGNYDLNDVLQHGISDVADLRPKEAFPSVSGRFHPGPGEVYYFACHIPGPGSKYAVSVHFVDAATGQLFQRGSLEVQWYVNRSRIALKETVQPDRTARFNLDDPLPSHVSIRLGSSMGYCPCSLGEYRTNDILQHGVSEQADLWPKTKFVKISDRFPPKPGEVYYFACHVPPGEAFKTWLESWK